VTTVDSSQSVKNVSRIESPFFTSDSSRVRNTKNRDSSRVTLSLTLTQQKWLGHITEWRGIRHI